MLTYLDRYKAAVGDQLWIDYYRATGLLERDQPQAALEAINHEQELVGEPALHLSIIRGCALAALNDLQAAQQEFDNALATPLVTVDYLSAPGISSLLVRALEASQKYLANTDFANRFEDRLLESYLAPEELFEGIRERQQPAEVTFYQILVRQPLDENWMTFPGRLAHEEEAESYLGSWGVLAEDDETAQKMVLQWQRRCYPLDAEVVEISGNDESFSESPGIVWQGQRIFAGDEDMEGFDGEFDGSDFDDPDFGDPDFDDDEDEDEIQKFEDD
jgi:hypothetical protein